MSIINIPTPSIGDEDWTSFVQQVGSQRRGYICLSITNFTTNLEPIIESGGVYDMNGSFWAVTSDTSITGWSLVSNGTVYIVLDGPGASWTAVTPTWDVAKGGYYNASGFRVIGGCIKTSSTTWTKKWLYHMPVVNANGKYVVPSLEVLGTTIIYWS